MRHLTNYASCSTPRVTVMRQVRARGFGGIIYTIVWVWVGSQVTMKVITVLYVQPYRVSTTVVAQTPNTIGIRNPCRITSEPFEPSNGENKYSYCKHTSPITKIAPSRALFSNTASRVHAHVADYRNRHPCEVSFRDLYSLQRLRNSRYLRTIIRLSNYGLLPRLFQTIISSSIV